MKERLQYIDIARGIAIICIILGHLGIVSINKIVFTFHVPIFFFITGYFTKKKSADIFIKDKIRTLLVPYYLTCLLMTVIGSIKGWMSGDLSRAFLRWSYASIYGAGDTYIEPFYIPSIGAIWFLWATFWGSCFLQIALNFNKYVRIFIVLVLFAFGYYSRTIFWFPFSIQAGACATLFMYMGFLFQKIKDIIVGLPKEIKIFGFITSVLTWFAFIRDFQSFWLVHCDIGRGIVDIFGCACACLVVVVISKFIERNTKLARAFLSYFGKYSILVLCIHIIELNLFPWWEISNLLVAHGMNNKLQLPFVIAGKLLLDLMGAYVLSKISLVKRLYGLAN